MKHLKSNLLKIILISMAFAVPTVYLHAMDRAPRQYKNDTEKLFIHASKVGDYKTVKRLLMGGINPNITSRAKATSLHKASRSGHIAIVKLLLEHNADPNVVNRENATPLFQCMYNKTSEKPSKIESFKMATLLLEHGANPNIAPSYGKTPLKNAAFYGHCEMVKLLLEYGSYPNLSDGEGYTSLSSAALCGQVNIAGLLFVYGACANPVKISALAKACSDNRFSSFYGGDRSIKTIKVLLACGADPFSFDFVKESTEILKVSTEVICLIKEARVGWPDRNKFCQVDADGNLGLHDEKLHSYIQGLGPAEQQAMIDAHGATYGADSLIIVKSIAQKHLNVLNNLKPLLEERHELELLKHPDIKTIKWLLARRNKKLLNGDIDKLSIDLLPYIATFLAPDQRPILDPLWSKSSRIIRAKKFDEIMHDDSKDSSLIGTDWTDALRRLEDRHLGLVRSSIGESSLASS